MSPLWKASFVLLSSICFDCLRTASSILHSGGKRPPSSRVTRPLLTTEPVQSPSVPQSRKISCLRSNLNILTRMSSSSWNWHTQLVSLLYSFHELHQLTHFDPFSGLDFLELEACGAVKALRKELPAAVAVSILKKLRRSDVQRGFFKHFLLCDYIREYAFIFICCPNTFLNRFNLFMKASTEAS